MATTYNCRPSELLDVQNNWQAFCLDRAVYLYGSHLVNELESVEDKDPKKIKRKREQVLERWFPEARAKKKFADPGRR